MGAGDSKWNLLKCEFDLNEPSKSQEGWAPSDKRLAAVPGGDPTGIREFRPLSDRSYSSSNIPTYRTAGSSEQRSRYSRVLSVLEEQGSSIRALPVSQPISIWRLIVMTWTAVELHRCCSFSSFVVRAVLHCVAVFIIVQALLQPMSLDTDLEPVIAAAELADLDADAVRMDLWQCSWAPTGFW